MSTEPFADFSLPSAHRLDQLCRQFEKSWQSGEGPRLETYIANVTEQERSALLKELLLVELELRQKAQEPVLIEEYINRFPDERTLIEKVWSRSGVSGESGTHSTAAYLSWSEKGREEDSDRTTDLDAGTEKKSSSSDLPGLPLPRMAGRYEIVSEIASGGMGAVLRARDLDFQRMLAVKIMLGGKPNRPNLEDRFLEEARITGQLQHPGIPPAHELGRLEDGRPFFAMKLIEGETLAHLLDRTKKDHPEDRTRFLAIFEQICQTIAYAHSQDIIHRDLKPANIMVGSFGEVQVMDWGLAKKMRREAESEAESADAQSPTSSNPDPLWTRAGSILGTPAYMSPEQARGEVNQLDKRCDVFGLGAILCRILTGKPPFAGENSQEIIQKAGKGDLTEAKQRLLACGEDQELIALALVCLAPAKEDRPPHAGAVAQTISAYQDRIQQRLRQAEIERAQSATKVIEERKRRRLWLGLAAAVLVLIVSASAVALWYQQDRALLAQQREVELVKEMDRQQRLEQDTKRSISDARDFIARLQFEDAGRELKQAQARFHPDDPVALQEQIKQWQSAWKLVRDLDQIRLDMSVRVKGKYFNFRALLDRYAELLEPAGLGKVEEADPDQAAAWVQQSLVKDYLISALEDWAALLQEQEMKRRRWLLAVVRKADPNPEINRLRDPDLWENPKALQIELATTDISRLSTRLVVALATRLGMHNPEALKLLHQSCRDHPRDFWINHNLADSSRMHKKYSDELAHYLVAQALRPGMAVTHVNLGVAYADMNERDKSIEQYYLALKIDPKFLQAHLNLGISYAAMGNLDKAIEQFQTAKKIDPNLARVYNNLGTAYAEKEMSEEAIEQFKLALKCRDTYGESQHAQAHYNLAVVYEEINDQDNAIKHYKEAFKVDPRYYEAHTNLGVLLAKRKDFARAIEQFQQAIKINPKDINAHHNLAAAYRDIGQSNKAIEQFQRTLQVSPAQARSHHSLANLHADLKQLDKAIEHYLLALEVEPNNATYRLNLGVAYSEKGQLEKAIEQFKLALKIEPNTADVNLNLASAYARTGQSVLALKHYKKTIEIDPTLPQAHGAMGHLLLHMGRLAEAKKSIQQALRLLPKNSPLRPISEQNLKECEQLLSLEKMDPKTGFVTSKNAIASFLDKLAKEDPLDNFPFTRKSHCKVHTVKLEQGKSYLIDLQGRFDPFLRVEDENKKPLLFNDDGGPPSNLNSRLVFAPKATQKFNLIVTSYKPGEVGDYSLQVREAIPSGNPKLIKDKLTTRDRNKKGKLYKMHKIELAGGKAHTLQVESKDFDTYLVLVDGKSYLSLGENDDISPGNRIVSRIDFTPAITNTYYIVVTSYEPGQTGAYELRVQGYEEKKQQ